jgi:hypothetical protein
MLEEECSLKLPDSAVVFWIHQGYQFRFVLAEGSDASTVYEWNDASKMFSVEYDSFTNLIDAELTTMERQDVVEMLVIDGVKISFYDKR